jgi:tRNA A-37 threonylcarbamoyl transferase component Bud32
MNFKTRGPIMPDDTVPYLTRAADRELSSLVQRKDYVALIGPRRSGKTSLLMRLWAELNPQPRFTLAYVDLSIYSTFDSPRWYRAVYNELVKSARGDLPVPATPVCDAIEFRDELLSVLENELTDRTIIILLDEVETVPEEVSTPFFATLRQMFVSRGLQPAFRRLSFVLAGSYIPDELIKDQSISPFRVAEKVYLQDSEDIAPLVAQLERPERPIASDVAVRIMEWTEGDLYLTQRICEKLDAAYPTGILTPNAVDQVVEHYVCEDDLFASLETKLKDKPRVLWTLDQINHKQTNLRFSRTNNAIVHGWLLGCLKPNNFGMCVIRNPIYETVLRELLPRLQATTTPPTSYPPVTKVPAPLQGRYVLEVALKRTMMAHVYRAIDMVSQNRVVVKQLLSGKEGDIISWRRFHREAEILRSLNHPCIVGLIDTFHVDEYNYIVMEYINGGTVDQLLSREGRQPLPLVLDIITGVADALRHAHQKNIIHRDIKPANILLTQELSPRLADFGVAYLLDSQVRITEHDAIVGTVAYLAPEGYSNLVPTPAQDVWSMGVTLYEMLTGVLPFVGRTQEHVLNAVLNDPIPNVRHIRPDVPEALNQLIKETLQRDPTKRLPDGEAVYQALQGIRAEMK